jgi:outer membrane receptor protein involved in Fe transport
MCRRAEIILLVIFASILSLNYSTARSNPTNISAEIKSRFDLPAESLDKALRDFAIQANCNIAYEPSIVAGLQAPPIKGEYTVGAALSLMLTGTKLRAVNVDEDTIQILEKSAATSQGASSTPNNRYPYGASIVRFASAAPDVLVPAKKASAAPVADSAENDAKARDKKDLEEIVVTGTHISGVASPSPVIEIGREEIERSGYASVADLMLSVPENFGGGYNPGTAVGNSQVNNRFGDNPTGASVPNLRGLGPGSTLTLIDGHRMASGLTGGGADISSIPLDAIDRIEIVTDSASSIYGSDAVAGVVNILLRRNYEGAKTNLSYGLATQGGGTEKRASQLFGSSWTGGNVVLAYEYLQQDAVDARNRAFTSSTPGPFSLLPQIQSNSLTLSSTQDIFPTTSAFIDGLFVARNANSFVTNPGIGTPYDNPSTLRKYAVTTGIDSNVGSDWKMSVFVNAAEDATQHNTGFLGPSLIPASDERLLGTLGGVEANANGGVASLPSGSVRLAVGAGYRREGFSDLFGATGGAFTDRTDGTRRIRYAFSEISIPLVEHSERPGLHYADLVISGRNERYSDFGAKTVPKVGLVYAPTDSIKLRATWGQAFRAPNLFDLNTVQQLLILDLANPATPGVPSPVLIRGGGNPALKPETADSWTFGFDYSPPAASGLRLSTTVFDIKYSNRISQIGNPYAALTDPLNASFVTRSPPTSVAQSIYDAYPSNEIFNLTGAPFSVGSTAAIVEYQLVNVSRQTARGADLTVSYKIGTDSNGATLFANGSYLDLTQQDTPIAPTETLSGLAFYPAKFRTRGGATWRLNSWTFTGTANYLARETNTQVDPIQSVGSWTTVDTSLRYAPTLPGLLSGLHFDLAAINVFDRNPPRVLVPPTVQGTNLNYDSSNTSPLGRFISLSFSKQW